jgi:hypothetical protein
MADILNQEVKTVQGLDAKLKKAEAGHDEVGALLAHQDLETAIKRINAKHDPSYTNRLMTALNRVDPNPAFKLDHGHLEMEPLHMAQAARPNEAGRPDTAPQLPNDPVSQSIQMERELLRKGENGGPSLYDKVARLPENAQGLPFMKSTQDPNSPDTILRRDDFKRYYDHMMKDPAHWTNDDKRQMGALKTLLGNFGDISRDLGEEDLGSLGSDRYYISKKAMGMNLARASAHALIDGGSNNLFDKIARETRPYEDPKTAHIDGFELNQYLEKHGNEIPEVLRTYLRTLASRMMIGPDKHNDRDWAAGLIGYDDGHSTYLTRQSITAGLRSYDLDSFVAKPFNQ